MTHALSLGHYLRSTLAALSLIAVAQTAYGIDTYNASTGQLTAPTIALGNATLSDVSLKVGAIVTLPVGNSPNSTQDTWDAATGHLTVPAVDVGLHLYFNAVVTVANLLSVGSVTGADTFDGTQLRIPFVQVGATTYRDVVLAVTVANVATVIGGMPTVSPDRYDPAKGQLTIAAVQVGTAVYTNVVLNVGPASIVSVGGRVGGSRSWSAPTLIQSSPDAVYVGNVQAAADADGSAFVVAEEWESGYHIHALRYSPASGWGADTVISLPASTDYAYHPQIVVDATHSATVVWEQVVGPFTKVYAARWTFGSGWGPPTLIQSENDNGSAPRLAADKAGNVVVAWTEGGGDVYVNRFVQGTGWGASQRLTALAAPPGSYPVARAAGATVAMDDAGAAMVVWGQTSNGKISVGAYASRYIGSGSWSAPELISSGSGDGDYLEAAMDSAGNTLAIYRENGSTGYVLYSAYYAVGTGWTSPVQVPDNGHQPQLRPLKSGSFIGLWDSEGVHSAHYTPGSGWANSTLLSRPLAIDGGSLDVDPAGNALALWTDNYNIEFSTAPGSGTWAAPQQLDSGSTSDGGAGGNPAIAAFPDGSAIGAWERYGTCCGHPAASGIAISFYR